MNVVNYKIIFLFCCIFCNLLYSDATSPYDMYWESQFNNRPEIILRSEFDNFQNSNMFSQGFLYSFTRSNKSKVCFCGEYKHVSQSSLSSKDRLFALRSRINYHVSPQTQWFLDCRVGLESSSTVNFGISHSSGPWYGLVIFEGNYKDSETPDIWVKKYHSMSGKLWTSLALTEKLYVIGHFSQKQYRDNISFSKKSENKIDRINIDPSIDFYLLGDPQTISGNIFDNYENLSPLVYSRSLVVSLINSIEITNGNNTVIQHVKILFSLPVSYYYGFFGSTSVGKNFITSADQARVHWSMDIGGYVVFSKRTGISFSYNSYNPSGKSFQTTYINYEVSVNYNL